jgi:hypothetical protein
MSEPGVGRMLRTATLMLAMLSSSRTGHAQSAADARAELDSLLPELRAARETVARAERARAQRVGATLIERGHLRITADSMIATEIAMAAAGASASLDRVFGAEAQRAWTYPLIATVQSVMVSGEPTRVIRVRRVDSDAQLLPDGRRIGTDERVVTMLDSAQGAADLRRALETIAATPLHATLDDDLRFWFRSALPATAESPEELETIYLELATASTNVSRRCLAGELRGCRQVLGLTPVDDPIMQGYTATQRRTAVMGSAQQLRTPGKAAEFDRCVVDADDAACLSRLRELPLDGLTRTYSTTGARRSFSRWILARGGVGAYARLRASAALPLDERLAVAGGAPTDSLVASWQAHVIAARPTLPGIPPVTAITTLLWIGACGALSLRSSRWR